MNVDSRPLEQRMRQVESLLLEVEQFADPHAQQTTRTIVQTLMDLHGAGLEAMLALMRDSQETGQALVQAFGRDGLISSLLLLYGLHPVRLEARVRAGLDGVLPTLRVRGCDAEIMSVIDGAVRLRLTGSGDESALLASFQPAIEEAIYGTAPDVVSIEIEVALDTSRLTPLPMLEVRFASLPPDR